MDRDNDGFLTEDDIVEAYQNFFGKVPDRRVIRSLFEQVDMDNSGTVEVSEFMIGAIDERVVFTQERLATAFKYFDKDGGGDISSDEIYERLGCRDDFTQEVSDAIMREVETKEGELSFFDFCRIIKKS